VLWVLDWIAITKSEKVNVTSHCCFVFVFGQKELGGVRSHVVVCVTHKLMECGPALRLK